LLAVAFAAAWISVAASSSRDEGRASRGAARQISYKSRSGSRRKKGREEEEEGRQREKHPLYPTSIFFEPNRKLG